MSVSSVATGSTVAASQFQSRSQGPGSYFRQLTQAIKSGDLDAAQSAYENLTNQLPASDQSSSTSTDSSSSSDSGKTSFQQFLQQVGAALDSGDIQGAQTALNSFEQTAKTTTHHHHHGGGGGGGVQASTATSADATASTSSVSATTGVNLTV